MTTFTIELDIGLTYLLQSALPLACDRSRDEDSSSWAVQTIVRPLPAPHWDPAATTAFRDVAGKSLMVPPVSVIYRWDMHASQTERQVSSPSANGPPTHAAW